MEDQSSLYLDVELLCRIIKSVEGCITATDKKMPVARRGSLIALLYERFFKSGEDVNSERISRYVGMMG